MIALVLRRGIEAAEELVSKVFAIPVSRAIRRERSAELAAAEEIVAKVFGIPIEKAKGKKNPNSVKGFDALVLGLLRDLVDDAAPTEKEAIKALSEGLDKNWPNMSKTEQGKAIDKAAAEWLGINRKIPVMNWPTYAAHGKTIVEQTKAATVIENGFRIVPSFDLADAKAIEASANMQALYTRNSYGVRNVQMSEQARKIVSAGIGEGLDRYEIGKNLEAIYTAGGVASFQRSAGYFRMIASVFTARARTWSNLSTYRDVGIETFRFEAVLDEVTTDVCRMMHGKTFSTSQALEGYTQVAASEDPEDVKTIQPWVQSGKNDQGEQILYYKNDKGARVPIANVKESGVGKKDTIGKYEGMSPKALQKAGISAPPLHAHCRSLIVPAGTSVGAGAVPKGPAPEAAPTPVAPPAAAIVSEIVAPPAPAPAPVIVPPPPAPAPVIVPPIVQPPRPVVAGPAIPTLPAELADAKAAVVWDATAKHEGVPLHGVPLKPVAKGFWDKHEDVDVGEPELVVPSGMHASAGLIIVEPDGRAWIVEPKGHFSNTKHTFPKGTRDAGESLQKTALREVWEESGLEGNIVGHLGDFTGETSITRYYVATRKGGAPWTFGPESQAVKLVPIGDLESFLNKERDKKITAALREKMAADPKLLSRVPPKAPEKPTPGKINSSDVILGEQTGPQAGSNPGGKYRGRDGVERYVKFYENREQAFSEHFANSLYRDIGQGAPETLIFEHNGKIGIASRIIPGKTFKDAGLTAERAKGFLDGFTADVLTANWDAVGTGQDNAYEGNDGKFYRIDNGGALLFRARGERKPTDILGKIGEWKSFFDPDRDYAKVLKVAGVTTPADMINQLRSGYSKIDALRKTHGGWKGYVDKIAPFMGDDERRQVASMLEARADLIRDEIAKIERALPKPSARYLAPQWSSVQPKPGLKVADLPEIDLMGRDKPKGYGNRYSGGPLPSGESRASYQKRADAAVKALDSHELGAVHSFTGSGYSAIRRTETDGTPDSRSDGILSGMKKCAPEPGTVWRGIHGRPSTMKDLLENVHGTIGLGQGNVGSTSSSAWDMSVAEGFAGGLGKPSDYHAGGGRVIYKINHQTGVSVETISSCGPGETEVLLHRDARFRLTGLSRMKGTDHVLIVELEEVLPGAALAPLPTPTPKTDPKFPKVIPVPANPIKYLESNTAFGFSPEQIAETEALTGVPWKPGDYDGWIAAIEAKTGKKTKVIGSHLAKPPLGYSPAAAELTPAEFDAAVAGVESWSGVKWNKSPATYEQWVKDVQDAAKTVPPVPLPKAAKEPKAAKPTKIKIPPDPMKAEAEGMDPDEWGDKVSAIENQTGIKIEGKTHAAWSAEVRAWEAAQKPAKQPKAAKVDWPTPPKTKEQSPEFWTQVAAVEQASGVPYSGSYAKYEDWKKDVAAAKKTAQAEAKAQAAAAAGKPIKLQIPPHPNTVYGSIKEAEWKASVAAIEAKTGIKTTATVYQQGDFDAWSEKVRAWNAEQAAAAKAPKLPKKIAGLPVPAPKPPGIGKDDAWLDQIEAIEEATGVKYDAAEQDFADWAKDAAAAAKARPKLGADFKIPPSKSAVEAKGGDVEAWKKKITAIENKTGIVISNFNSALAYDKWKDEVSAWQAKQPKAEPTPKAPKVPKLVIPPSALDAHKQGLNHEDWYAQVTAVEQKTGVKFKSYMTHQEWVGELKTWEKEQKKQPALEPAAAPKPAPWTPPKTIAGVRTPELEAPTTPDKAGKWVERINEIGAKTGVPWAGGSIEDWIKEAQTSWEVKQEAQGAALLELAGIKPKTRAPKPVAAASGTAAPKQPTMIGSYLLPKEPDPKLSANDPAWNKYDADTAAISTAYGVAPWHHFKTHDEWVAAVADAAAKVKKRAAPKP